MMSNVLTVVSKSLRGAITCVKLDADKYPGLASRYKIKALPTLVLFKVRRFDWLRATCCMWHVLTFPVSFSWNPVTLLC